MAVDEVLLTSAVEGKLCSARVYQWAEPTVSLGYFQREDDPELSGRLSGLARVRRLSGGGAILHHRELTYSCAVPAAHPIAREPSRLYDAVHKVILEVLAEHGVVAALRGESDDAAKPFLCFGRGDARDIIIGRHKIVGSAQRRRSGAVLQHGSLLLECSRYAPEFPGIHDLCHVAFDRESLSENLARRIAEVLGDPVETVLSGDEADLARYWQLHRYATALESPMG